MLLPSRPSLTCRNCERLKWKTKAGRRSKSGERWKESALPLEKEPYFEVKRSSRRSSQRRTSALGSWEAWRGGRRGKRGYYK